MEQISKTCAFFFFYLFQEIQLCSLKHCNDDSLDVENPPATKAKNKTLASFFKETTHTTPTASLSTTLDPMVQFGEAVAAELNAYIYMPCVDHGEFPMKWWQFHKINFPRLRKLAQKYLCI